MKKFLLISIILSMLLCFTACAKDEDGSLSQIETTQEETTDSLSGDNSQGSDFNLPEGVTFAQYIFEDFKGLMSENSDMTTEQLADELIKNEAILFDGVTNSAEPGFLQGFDTEITGFKSGSMFGPFISSIPFIGYVFELENESEAEAFVETLKSNANPAWQVCVEAEETVCESIGNKVFFVMAPLSNS